MGLSVATLTSSDPFEKINVWQNQYSVKQNKVKIKIKKKIKAKKKKLV